MITYTVRSGEMNETIEAPHLVKLDYILLRAILQWDPENGSLGALAEITTDEGAEPMYLSTQKILDEAGMIWD